MEQEKKIRVAITHGDTNGVGYEVILKAFEDPSMFELCTPIVYGSPKVAAYHAKALGIETQFSIINDWKEAQEGRLNLLNCFGDEEIKVDLGTATPESGEAALQALIKAVDDYRQGAFDVLVTAPVFKNSIKNFSGHTAYLEQQLGNGAKGISILHDDDVSVTLVTNNLAVKDIPEAITRQKIVEKAQLMHQALRRELRISSPRIAVLALNPRCGEEGVLGNEEQETIIPAINELKEQGIQAFGPYAADDFFGSGSYYRFDGVLAMYHDQGQTPFKTLASYDGIRLTAGLPLVRTAPSHGANFPQAGRNLTDADSIRNAIFTAIDVFRNRANYDEPLQNPLPKLYHEKRDDSEKVRFRSSEPHADGDAAPNKRDSFRKRQAPAPDNNETAE